MGGGTRLTWFYKILHCTKCNINCCWSLKYTYVLKICKLFRTCFGFCQKTDLCFIRLIHCWQCYIHSILTSLPKSENSEYREEANYRTIWIYRNLDTRYVFEYVYIRDGNEYPVNRVLARTSDYRISKSVFGYSENFFLWK